MPRRMIHDELFANIDLGECPLEARLFYIGMIVHADDQGRMRADIRYLKAKIFPFDNLPDDTCLTWRNQLATKGLIVLYDVGQKTYLQHPKWDRWQTLRKDRVKPSDCPSPSVDGATKWQPPDNLMSDRRSTNVGVSEVKRSEVKGTEEKLTPFARSEKTDRSEPASHPWLLGLELYTSDPKLKVKIWEVDKAWMKAYPGIDIGVEIRKAHAWEMANPAKRKVNRIRFFNTWLSRAQDDPRTLRTGASNGTHDGKSMDHVSPSQTRPGSLGLTPSQLRAIVDEAKRKELSPGFRDHALVASDRTKKSKVDEHD